MHNHSLICLKKILAASLALLSVLLMSSIAAAAGTELPAELRKRMFLSLKTGKTEAYEGERIALTVTLYTEGISVRDVLYPQLRNDGFSMAPWGPPVRRTETRGGIGYDALEFASTIVPKETGSLALGPADLQCNVLVPSSKGPAEAFFGAQEAHAVRLKSEGLSMKILPLPTAGRPADFHGAVGRFDLAVEIQPRKARAGNPLTVAMTITGSGSLDGARCPEVHPAAETEKAFRIYPPQRFENKGGRICEQILVPLSGDVQAVPPIRFSFFDPERGSYATVRKGPFPLTVAGSPGALSYRPQAESRNFDSEGRPWGFWALLLSITASLIALAAVAYRWRAAIGGMIEKKMLLFRKAMRLKRALGEAERSMDRGDVSGFYTVVFRMLQEWLGDAFHLPSAGITEDIVEGVLLPAGIDGDLPEKIRILFRKCDQARYASFRFGRQEMQDSLATARDVISRLRRFHGSRRP
ncbi:MAG: BatD family protein [Acidobacteria bacterium]|nr:BatD family protein [Acidobacteriota bacterium]